MSVEKVNLTEKLALFNEHPPVAEEEAHVMLFEPASTLDTGNVTGELTAPELERI